MRTSIVLAFSLIPVALGAQTLDPSFGTGGVVLHNVGAREVVMAATLDAAGKVLVVGWEDTGTIDGMLLARFNTDGSPDLSFGTDGAVIAAEVTGTSRGMDVAVQADGKILVGGQLFLGGLESHMFVRRFQADGTPDLTFGTNGRWVSALLTREEAYTMALQADGKIIVAGRWANPWPNYRGVVYRVNADGSTDTGFGTNGAMQHPDNVDVWFEDCAVQPDGRILAYGTRDLEDISLMRLNTDGTLDAGFATNGVLNVIDGAHDDFVNRMVLNDDGTLFLSVLRFDAVGEALIYQVSSTGSLLPYGGSTGLVIPVTASWVVWNIGVDAAGRILMTGVDISSTQQAMLVRVENGLLDPLFGTAGAVTSPIADVPNVRAVLQRPDGRLVLVGWGANATDDEEDIWMVQYGNVPASVGEAASSGSLTLAPNPVEDRFALTSVAPFATGAHITVRDMGGRAVRVPCTIGTQRIAVDASDLRAGVYTLVLSTRSGPTTLRFLKQ
jgi:uncharacterized delta-60 repeat protein